MITIQHTPGPWKISDYGDGGEIVAVADPEAVLCHVFGTQGEEEYAENARLVAAAPDMREALQRCVTLLATAHHYFPKSIRNSDTFALNVACAAVNNALAKAGAQ